MEELTLRREDVSMLLACAGGDAVKLYLHLLSGASLQTAGHDLRLSESRLASAIEELRQLRLLREPPVPKPERQMPEELRSEQAPVYSDREVIRAMEEKSGRFRSLAGEFHRRYGRSLSTEELRSLLVMTDFLKLDYDLIGMLLSFCIERARKRGLQRAPTVRMVEREAYIWREQGIVTFEKAAVYMQQQLERFAQVNRVAELLQIFNRRLTDGEERCILGWLEQGFGEPEIRLAYERTLEELGQFKWRYTKAILNNWHNAGLHTLDQIRAAEERKSAKPMTKNEQRNAQYERHGEVSDMGYEAIRRMMQKEGDNGIQ